MGAELSPAARRVQRLLGELGSDSQVVQLAATARSAADAAAVGCSVAQICKSLIFRASGGNPVLVIASGSNRVDEKKIAAALGEAIVKADADFVRDRTGYAIGGVAPIGHAAPPRIFIDADLFHHDVVWAAAGHPHAVFAVSPAELLRMTGGAVVRVA